MKQRPARRIIFLDYLRIFAFTSVLAGHKLYPYAVAWVEDATVHPGLRLLVRLIMPLIAFGGAGVVVFFLVSGYIIIYVLQAERAPAFLLKRIFRIYPLYITAVLLQIITSGNVPSAAVLIPRLLLLGDFFGTPYALASVEWTLRVEIVFYGFMALLRALGVIPRRAALLPWIFVAATLILDAVGPFPASAGLYRGSFTVYAPFLLLGALFFLAETGRVARWWPAGFAALVLVQYYRLIPLYLPAVVGAHFAALGLLVFSLAWGARARLKRHRAILLLSELTFAVYLFHNWTWGPIKEQLERLAITALHPEIQTLIVVLALSLLMTRLVEQPAVRAGARLARKLRM